MTKFVLKFSIPLAALGAVITLITTITSTWDFGLDQHGSLARLWFSIAMTVMAPAADLASLLGIPQRASRLLWILLAVAINTIICLLIGASLGGIAALIFRRTPKPNDPAI